MKRYKAQVIILGAVIATILICSLLSGLMNPLLPLATKGLLASEPYTSGGPDLEPSVSFTQIGLVGGVETDILITQLTEGGKKVVLLGTSKGLYIISEGALQKYIPTLSSVSDITLLGDVTGDGQQEIVVAIDDIYFPNIRCYDSTTGDKVWHFAPRQEVFLENLLWIEQQTRTFDIEVIDDVNSDGYQDIAATSGYCLYLLDGKTGEQLWRFEAEDNLWRVSILPDVDGDGIEDLAVGAQTGFMYVLSGGEGNLIWQSRVAEECTVIDDEGNKWATIDRAVWDIMPLQVNGKEKAIVSSEDGKVRLIDLQDGTCDWETLIIEYSSSLLYNYYQHKDKRPTSPGDDNFFNLRISTVEDVSGDGIEEILASTYVGQLRGGSEGYAGTSGLFLINSASGETIWKETGLDLANMVRVETAWLGGKQVILLPQEKSASTAEVEAINIEDGEAIKTLEIVSTPFVATSEYWAKEYDANSFILVSDYEDLLCVSSQGEVLWHYPRISDVTVEEGEFVGDATPDLFIWSRHRISGWNEFGARVLYVVDGATKEKVWDYEIPYKELADVEGITGIQVTPDLNGDGKQDIVGYTQPQSTGETEGGYKIRVFSGSDGSILLNQPVVTQTYYGIYDQLYKAKDSSTEEFEALVSEMLNKGVHDTYYDVYEGLDEKPFLKGLVDDFVQQILNERGEYDPSWANDTNWMNNLKQFLDDSRQEREINKQIVSLDIIDIQGDTAFIVGCRRDIFIISPEGELLWTKTENPWVYEDPFRRVQPEGMRSEVGWDTCYYSLGDMNGDGIDDLVVCENGFICTMMSIGEGGEFDFEPAQQIYNSEGKPTEGVDPRRVQLVDDIDGDGIREVSFFKWRERRPDLWTIASPASGVTLLEMEWHGGGDQNLDLSCTDFNNDGYADHLFYWRWREDIERPVVEIISRRDGKILWQFVFEEHPWLYDGTNIEKLMPAAPISDLNNDGIAELALLKVLGDQPGTRMMIYKIVPDNPEGKLLKEIVIENFDPKKKWERRWQPGILVKEVGDFNGDGIKEIALVTMLGESRDEKEAKVIVVDVVTGRVIADFHIVGSQLMEIGEHSKLGVVGLSGEFYLLDVANNLHITSPAEGSTQTSPVKIQWEGVSSGVFNQIFIDDVEVARTNDNEVTLDVAQGEHKLMIRSLDEYGRGVYAIVKFTVKKGNPTLLSASIAMVILVLVAVSPMLWRKFTKFRYKG